MKTWGEKQANEYLSQKEFSLNSKSPSKIVRKSLPFKKMLIAANEVSKNIPSIQSVKGEDLTNIDLITYSFPCQGLSVANMGRDLGIERSLKSTSNLVWEVGRILQEARDKFIKLPSFLLMENVKNLISEKHISSFNGWKKHLKDLGYETYSVVINSMNHSSVQKRERLFAISFLSSRFKSLNITDRYLKELFEQKDGEYYRPFDAKKRRSIYIKILKDSNKFPDELLEATPNNTASRILMAENNPKLLTRKWRMGFEYTFNTIPTKQDRDPNTGMIKLDKTQIDYNSKHSGSEFDYRLLTPREVYKIMGFTNKDFNLVNKLYKESFLTKASLYRQAGNSIVVPVMEDVFSWIEEIWRQKHV